MYHGIQASAEDDGLFDPVYSVSNANFTRHLDLMLEMGFQSQRLDDALTNPAQKPVVISFDDGDVTNYTKAFPLMKERDMVGEFFITTDRIGTPGSMDSDQLRSMLKAGMSIQGHGHTHRYLSDLSSSEIEFELATCKQTLENICNQAVVSMALPGGRGNAEVTRIAKSMGYELLCTSEVGHNTLNSDRFAIQRIPILATTSLEQLQQYLTAQGSAWRKIIAKQKLLGIVKQVLGNANYDKLRGRLV